MLFQKFRKINWKSGASAAIYYVAIMWILVLSVLLFMEYFNGYTTSGRTQLFADLLADGSVFIGNNGWGLDEKEADKAYKKLYDYNKDNFKNITTTSKKYYYTDKKGTQTTTQKVYGDNKNNTMSATVNATANSFTGQTGPIKSTNSGDTHITYSGGLKIVLEAWKHTYEYTMEVGGGRQTRYVWGGGHANLAEWEEISDCSGFASGVYRKCGYTNIQGCTWDLEYAGKAIYKGGYAGVAANAMPGDLILYWYRGKSGDGQSEHVVIYAGEHEGVPYVVENKGGQQFHGNGMEGSGPNHGAHIDELNPNCSCYKVVRIVDTTAKPARVPLVTYKGFTADETKMFNVLRSAGYSTEQIAGIMGNAMCEGGCKPITCEGYWLQPGGWNYCINFAKKIKAKKIGKYGWITHPRPSDGGPEGYGVCQWTWIPRKEALWDLAEEMHSNVTDINVQATMIARELSSFGLADSYKNINNVNTATAFFYYKFEGPPPTDTTLPNRMAAAWKYTNPVMELSGKYY